MQWADDLPGIEPLPKLEPFFTYAALELGDPEDKHWLVNNSPRFYDLYRQYHTGVRIPCQPNKALIQYLVWYSRYKDQKVSATQLTHAKITGKVRP